MSLKVETYSIHSLPTLRKLIFSLAHGQPEKIVFPSLFCTNMAKRVHLTQWVVDSVCVFFYFFLNNLLAAPLDTRDLILPTRGQTCSACFGSVES